MTNYQNVSARAMLVNLHISTWTARKFDRRGSEQVTDDAKADRNAGRYNKHLLAGAAAHADVLKRAMRARAKHYSQTLPWGDESRLLPTANYFAYTEAMRQERAAFDRALVNFVDEYPALRDQAPVKLGALYSPNEFPDVRTVARRFDWVIDFSPVPSGCDIRLDLPADQIAEIERSVEERVERVTREAMADAWRRLSEAVVRIQKAAAPGGVVRGSLIDHARDVVDVLGRLNVGEDADLDAMRDRVLRELTTIAPEDLRTDDRLRADTATRAENIIATMGAFYAPSSPDAVDAIAAA